MFSKLLQLDAIIDSKCVKKSVWRPLPAGHAAGAYSASPDPTAGFKGLYRGTKGQVRE